MFEGIEVNNLTIALNSNGSSFFPVNDVELSVKRGELMGLVGESGSGKTLTALNIAGFCDIYPGVVKGSVEYRFSDHIVNLFEGINEKYVTDTNGHYNKSIHIWKKQVKSKMKLLWGKHLNILFQNPQLALNPYKTIGEQIEESIGPDLNIKREIKAKAINNLKLLRFHDPEQIFDCYPFELSGGMAQRAMLGITLASKPDFIILDEPTTGLDVTLQWLITKSLKEIKQKEAMTGLLISHDLNFVAHLAEKISVMYAGEILETGRRNVLTATDNRKIHPYTEILLSPRSNKQKDFAALPKFTPNDMGCNYRPRCHIYSNARSLRLKEKCECQKPELRTIGDSHKIRCWNF